MHEKMNVKIWPYTSGDGGIACMPLQSNIPNPNRADWKLMTCPKCGRG